MLDEKTTSLLHLYEWAPTDGVGVYGRLLYMASVPALGLKSPYSQLTPFILSCPPKLAGVNFCGYSMFV